MSNSETMRMLDARRLTGLNVIWPLPSAIVDVAVPRASDMDALIAGWNTTTREICDALTWGEPQLHHRQFVGGVSLVMAAPIDALYAAVEIAEWACLHVLNELQGNEDAPETRDDALVRFRELIAEEQRPRMLEIGDAASANNVAMLWDDDEVSVGLGRGSQTWPVDALPAAIDWDDIHDVPVALVTGTNGKTTTVRLISRILRAAGKTVGMSSTDAISVDDRIVDRGDYSGPGGARTVLRQPDVDVAVLETARGGLLRRGLGVARADAALITNISRDHLGDFGSANIVELTDLKWLVMQALDARSVAVLNADDPILVARATSLTVPRCWFAMDPANPVVVAHIEDGGTAFSVIDDSIARFDGQHWQAVCALDEIPITLNGVARHNIANALAAAALSHALDVADPDIAAGLRSMQVNDNAGRCNLFHIDGVDVLLDFAHNPHAMSALFDIAAAHPARRRVLCFGQAGDRTDGEIRELASGAWAIGLERVIVSELAPYYRGREPGEVFGLMRDALLDDGAEPAQIGHHDTEAESLQDALDWAEAGDLVIMLALSDAGALIEQLSELAQK